MKYLYTSPEIKVEELAKFDVLCASGVDEPIKNGINNIEGSASSWLIEESL
ncbi:MAG: hypothetical protein K6F88_02250 [Ruminococcus sp.]|nr:hypothetical protein [Ruminococcus sp.]